MADGSGMGSGQAGFGFGEVPVPAAAAPSERKRERDAERSRRKRSVRSKTLSVGRALRSEAEALRLHYEEPYRRPETRDECPEPGPDGVLRCAFVGCVYNTYLDVNEDNGSIKFVTPDVPPGEQERVCVLDAAEEGGMTLEQTGVVLNITRERVRQIERSAVAKLLASGDPAAKALAEFAAMREGDGKRRLPVVDKRLPNELPDLTGRRFDECVVLERLGSDEHHHRLYRCRCACGGEYEARGDYLLRRRSTECPACRPAPSLVGRPVRGPAPAPTAPPPADWSGRERALMRACERLGRFTEAAALAAAGCRGESWMLARLASAGVVRRDGDAYAWAGCQQAAE